MLKVGIIGLGGIARSHCDSIAHLDNVQVVAVADLFEEKRQEYMDKYDIPKGYQTHHELLKDDEIDAVAVVLGHQLHHQLTVDACNAGKHVLVEKPMALSLDQCDAMIEAAANNDVKLMVGLSQHFYPTSVKAKEILDSGELGPLITAIAYMSKNWNYSGRRPQYRSRYHGGGMWLTNGIHSSTDSRGLWPHKPSLSRPRSGPGPITRPPTTRPLPLSAIRTAWPAPPSPSVMPKARRPSSAR